MPRKIFIDTNFLLIPAQFKVDIYSEIERLMHEPYELCVFDASIAELDKIAKKGATLGLQVKLAKALLKSKRLNIVPLPSETQTVDEGLLALTDSIVATLDVPLKRALKAKQTPHITLRQKKYLILVN